MRILIMGILAAALVVGCSKDKKAHSHAQSGHDHSMHAMDGKQSPHADHDRGMGHGATGGKVTVTAAGQKFKPPIKPAQLPDGAWYCDMGGNVHYARGTKGDGKCSLCQMKLHHKVASK